MAILSVPLLLSACSYSKPTMRTHSMMVPSQSQIAEGLVTEKFPMSEISYHDTSRLGLDHGKRGAGPATVMVLYNNGECPKASLKLASKQGDMIREQMAENGAGDISVHATPVNDALGNRAIISYSALNVLPPEGCETRMDGLTDRDFNLNNSYRLGCENERLIGQMVSRPADLMGRDPSTDDTTQRQGVSGEGYRAGENLFSGDRTGEPLTTGAVE